MEYRTGEAGSGDVYVSTEAEDWSAPPSEAHRTRTGSGHGRREGAAHGNRPGSRPSPASSAVGSLPKRAVLALVGVLLVLVGIPMLILPGPGLLAIGAGAACLGRAFGFGETGNGTARE